MKKYSRFFLVFAFLFTALAAHAAEEYKFISTEDLTKGIQDKKLVVIDCNTPEVFKAGHIPGAIFLDTSKLDASVLPKDKTASLVFYCKNPRCMASHKGAGFAKSNGYANIQVYPLGIEGWEKAGQKVEK